MKLEWIEDLIALCETQSLTEAAARRHVTQPAFSRRVRAIEEDLGMALVDRTRRPARPLRSVIESAPAFRELAGRLRQLPATLGGRTRIVIACQHALSVSLAPKLAGRVLAAQPDATVRLRSANRDECLALLMTQQANMMVAYETDELPVAPAEHFVEKSLLAHERLLPVAAPESPAMRWQENPGCELPVILYPDDVFLGMALSRTVLPALARQVRVRPVIETALTLAARELARAGLGVAWVPESLAAGDLEEGRLAVLPGEPAGCTMALAILRPEGPKTAAEERAWQAALGRGEPQPPP